MFYMAVPLYIAYVEDPVLGHKRFYQHCQLLHRNAELRGGKHLCVTGVRQRNGYKTELGAWGLVGGWSIGETIFS